MPLEKNLQNSKENKEKLKSYLKYLNPIFDFLTVENSPQKSDVIFVFGSTKHYVARHAAKLYLKEFSPYILISGHKSERSDNLYKKEVIKKIVGEIDRLKIYAEKGDIIREDIPSNIETAAKKLKDILENN